MVHPKVFQKLGIMVFEGEQHPGYYTIIWPGVYHFGFNKGKNVAEVRFFKNGENTNINSHSLQAVAFAPKCWMDYTINMQTPLYHSMKPWIHKATSRNTFQATITVSGSRVQDMQLAKGKFLYQN